MSLIIDWKTYYTLEEAISLWNNEIEARAKKLFFEARKNRIAKENDDKIIEKLFTEWKLNINKHHHYV
jgi:hypothetical protein